MKVKPDIINGDGYPRYLANSKDTSRITTIKAMKNIIALVSEMKQKGAKPSSRLQASYEAACAFLEQIGEQYP